MTDRATVRQQPLHEVPQRREVHLPYGVRASAAWVWRIGVIGLGIFGLLYLIAFFQVVVVPVLVAILITALLSPYVNLLHRLGLPRGAAVAVSILVALLVILGLLVLVGAQFVAGFDDLAAQSGQGFGQVQRWLVEGPLNLTTEQLNVWLARGQEQLKASSDQLVAGALSFTSTAGHVITGAFLAFFATLFFLLDGRGIWRWLLRLLPEGSRDSLDDAGERGWLTLSAYVKATIIVAFVDAVGIGLGAVILQLPLAVPIAVLVFLGGFIPIVGAFVSGIVAVLIALVSHGPVAALIMLGVVIAVQQIESHVLQPFLLGRAVAVHPLAVVLAIAAGVLLAGIVGALFAVPLVAVLNTMITQLAGRGVPVDEIEPPVETE
ncbi:MAG: AI-2E family transporter [Actinomycetes bacterium]